MKNIQTVLGLASVLLLVGCSEKLHTWTEEVQTQNNGILVTKRTISFKEYQPAGGGGGSDIIDSTIEITGTQRPGNPGRWSNPPLIPMIFDRDPDSQEWFIVATFYMCNTWYELGRPKLPYAEFRYRGGKWVQQPLSEKFIGMSGNMLVPNQGNVDRNHTLASKALLMNEPGISPRHKQVVKQWKTNC